MSRIGKVPIPIPDKVNVTIKGQAVTVKGPKGELSRELTPEVAIEQADNVVTVTRRNESRVARQRHGLSRTLVANMVEGVSKGFEKKLQIQGVGYLEPPEGIQVAVESNTSVTVSGINKEVVGNTAARIRAVRPPEPYKGKGIRYADEFVRRKVGKAGKK